jgi:hypothetical protein
MMVALVQPPSKPALLRSSFSKKKLYVNIAQAVLVCSTGLHQKTTAPEFRSPGPLLFLGKAAFWRVDPNAIPSSRRVEP